MVEREHLRAEVDRAAGEMAAKMNAIEQHAVDIRDHVRESLTLRHQVEERPWKIFGAAFATGFVVGMLLR